MVFGLFTCVIDVLWLLNLYILVLLMKTQLLVPNLCLWDLAVKSYGQKRLKFAVRAILALNSVPKRPVINPKMGLMVF